MYPTRFVFSCDNKYLTILVLLFVSGLFPTTPKAGMEVQRLTNFDVVRSYQDALDSTTNWNKVTLPDSWQEHQNPPFKFSWYRTILDPPDINSSIAVYVPRVSMNISISVNGHEIGNAGRFSEPISRNHGRPLIFYVPMWVYAESKQLEILIKVADNSWALGYLGPVYIGNSATLTNKYRKREFFQVQLTTGLALLMVIFSIASFTLYIKRTKDTYFLWFGAAMLLFSIDTFNVFITDIPVARKTFEIYNQMVIFAFACATLVFIHRFTKVGWKLVEPVMAILLISKLFVLLLVDVKQLLLVASFFNITLIGYGLVLATMVVTKYIKTSSFESGVTAFAGIVLLTVAFHTWLVQVGILNPENLHIIHYGAPGFFLLISLSLVRRFLKSLEDTEELALSLDTRVKEKQQELAESYTRLNKIQQEHTLSEERARIMREVHDGFGGQLVGALAMLENHEMNRTEVSEHLKSSLLDLRIIIDSLDPNVHEMVVALGMLRTRIEPVLKNKNIKLSWDTHDLPFDLNLRPNDTLSVLRILQELITNIVKHSNANTVFLKVSKNPLSDQESLLISLGENGNGFDPNNQTGKGLKNLRKRVFDLQGNINFESQKEGFMTSISIPLISHN